MISTTILRSSIPGLTKGAIFRPGPALILAPNAYFEAILHPQKKKLLLTQPTQREFSSSSVESVAPAVPLEEPGFVTKKLRALNVKTVKEIMEELRAVSTDDRLDTRELKKLLRKHKHVFTEEEIVQVGELFYAGKSGGSVSFDKFIEAIDHVVQMEESGGDTKHVKNPLDVGTCGNEYLFYKNHSSLDWKIELTHTAPKSFSDRLAFNTVKAVRFVFDAATGWNNGDITKNKVLNRTIYLETIAAVPGMVAAVVRHFKSLRTFQRDGGMMQMFLDEATNERMHLLSFVRMKDPNMLFRLAVIGGQVGFGSAFLVSYLISPKFCHRFVGYVEEEACSTYTKIIHAIENADEGNKELAAWRTEIAPRIARSYWKLGEKGTVLDLMYAVRADEAEHRDVNHLCSSMEEGMANPVSNTEEKLNTMLLKYFHDLMDRRSEDAGGKRVTSA